jgi:hypothetical protein
VIHYRETSQSYTHRIITISKLNADRSDEHHLKVNESCNKALVSIVLLVPADIEDSNFKNKSKITALLREYREIRSEIWAIMIVEMTFLALSILIFYYYVHSLYFV